MDVFEAARTEVYSDHAKMLQFWKAPRAFSKDLMKKYGYSYSWHMKHFDRSAESIWNIYDTQARFPIVLKADGLALGKGVLICNTLEEAEAGVTDTHARQTVR